MCACTVLWNAETAVSAIFLLLHWMTNSAMLPLAKKEKLLLLHTTLKHFNKHRARCTRQKKKKEAHTDMRFKCLPLGRVLQWHIILQYYTVFHTYKLLWCATMYLHGRYVQTAILNADIVKLFPSFPVKFPNEKAAQNPDWRCKKIVQG